MIEKFLERADVLDFLRECLTDSRFVNTTTSEMFEEDLFLKNQYGLLFAMDALIKFDIIVGDPDLIDEYVAQLRRIMKKFNTGNDLYLGLNKTLGKLIASKLNLEDTDSPENKKAIIKYIYERYIQNGYIFHSFPAEYLEEIKNTGIDSSEAYYNLEEVKEIDAIFKNHGMGKVFDGLNENHNYAIDITDSPLIAYFNALNMPKYLNTFTSTNEYLLENKYDRNAFYKKDKVACLDNIKRLSNNAGLTNQEKEKVLAFFEKEWKLYKCNTCSPYIMFIKRSSLAKNYLDHYQAILDNCHKEDVSFSIEKILESRYKHEKISVKLNPNEYKFVKLAGYKKVYFGDEEGFEEIFPEKEKEEEETPSMGFGFAFANNYGGLTIVFLLGIILVLVGIILILLGFYQ